MHSDFLLERKSVRWCRSDKTRRNSQRRRSVAAVEIPSLTAKGPPVPSAITRCAKSVKRQRRELLDSTAPSAQRKSTWVL